MRALRWLLGIFAALVLVVIAGVLYLRHPLPSGTTGPEADSLAHRIESGVDLAAWQRTGAVRFTFRNDTQHLWDRVRNFDRVRFSDGTTVLLDVGMQRGVVSKTGHPIAGPAADALVKQAYARFCNDTFWLNPLAKLFDDGVTRSRVVNGDGESLLIHYASGGVTPGDTYQWIMGESDRPRAWRMFVRVIKLPGLEMSWQDWVTLPTGARIATTHRVGTLDALRLTDVTGGATLADVEAGADPFAQLAGP